MGTRTAGPDVVIEIRDLVKTFRLSRHGPTTLVRWLRTLGRDSGGVVLREALRGVSLDVARGERLGIVGTNGSGKTTLLRTACGIYRPTRGVVRANGRVAAFLKLGIGMVQRMTVRENVFLYGAIHGLTRREIAARFDRMLAFAELTGYEDSQVRELSSGMVQRLTFAVAIEVDADILLLDEVLAVGDQQFKNKCHRYLAHELPRSRTVLFASHDLLEIERFCHRTLWLDAGLVRAVGDTPVVLRAYREAVGLPPPPLSPSLPPGIGALA
jgi:ABC-type polysaccharide/polyol phosphate transport system ATPase subunit